MWLRLCVTPLVQALISTERKKRHCNCALCSSSAKQVEKSDSVFAYMSLLRHTIGLTQGFLGVCASSISCCQEWYLEQVVKELLAGDVQVEVDAAVLVKNEVLQEIHALDGVRVRGVVPEQVWVLRRDLFSCVRVLPASLCGVHSHA